MWRRKWRRRKNPGSAEGRKHTPPVPACPSYPRRTWRRKMRWIPGQSPSHPLSGDSRRSRVLPFQGVRLFRARPLLQGEFDTNHGPMFEDVGDPRGRANEAAHSDTCTATRRHGNTVGSIRSPTPWGGAVVQPRPRSPVGGDGGGAAFALGPLAQRSRFSPGGSLPRLVQPTSTTPGAPHQDLLGSGPWCSHDLDHHA